MEVPWENTRATHSNVSSRFGGIGGRAIGVGFNNIELITDALWAFQRDGRNRQNFSIIVISSLMVETKEEWKDIIKRSSMLVLTIRWTLAVGMCERYGFGCGQEPAVNEEITSWVMGIQAFLYW